MRQVRLLANTLYVRNLQGDLYEHRLVITAFYLENDEYLKLSSSLNSGFSIEINSFEIEKFYSESSGVLYVDSPITIREKHQGKYELSCGINGM